MQEFHVRTTLEKCCMSYARGACVHARTFQGTRSRQIDSFLLERECLNLQQETMKLAYKNNTHTGVGS